LPTPGRARIEEPRPCCTCLGQWLRHAISFRERQVKARVRHAEGAKQSVLQDMLQTMTGNHFQNSTQDICSMAVVPDRSGLTLKGECCKSINEIGIRKVLGKKSISDVGPLSRAVTKITVGQARRVPHQILDGWCLSGRHLRAIGAHHTQVRERRDELCDGLIEPQQSTFDEHHRRCRNDWLGHRIDSPNSVRF
jgi:hypothetical protein